MFLSFDFATLQGSGICKKYFHGSRSQRLGIRQIRIPITGLNWLGLKGRKIRSGQESILNEKLFSLIFLLSCIYQGGEGFFSLRNLIGKGFCFESYIVGRLVMNFSIGLYIFFQKMIAISSFQKNVLNFFVKLYDVHIHLY